jgi:hypothetical protein
MWQHWRIRYVTEDNMCFEGMNTVNERILDSTSPLAKSPFLSANSWITSDSERWLQEAL